MATEITIGDSVIDSRDVIARLEELQEIKDRAEQFIDLRRQKESGEGLNDDDMELFDSMSCDPEIEDWNEDSDIREEYEFLKALDEAFSGCGDWDHDAALILDS